MESAKIFLSPEELMRVLRVAHEQSTRDWYMILVAYRHGLRTSEVCGLKLADVRGGSLIVQRLKGSLKTVQPLLSHPSQPLLDEVSGLRKWLKERRHRDSDFLFTSRRGGQVHRPQFFRLFQAIAQKAALPKKKRHPRILKYSLVAHLLARNVDVSVINHLLGHIKMDSTLRYLKPTDTQATAAAQAAIKEIFRAHRGEPST